MTRTLLLNAIVSALLVALGLAAYDRWVLRPALVVGVVDLAEVYRAKETEFTRLLTQPGSDAERERALALARNFSQRLPAALDELPQECGCLVVIKSAIAGTPHGLDLTAALRRKVDLP
jgi:NAD-dependent oxidoreductase involved in siderophore biosynthesis